jgi:tetratricopeptide (TPR) repeat protein
MAYAKAKKLLELATEKSDNYYKAFSNFYMGISNFGLRKFSNVEEHLKIAIQYFEKKNLNSNLAEAKEILAVTYQRTGQHEDAIKLFEENVEYYTNTNQTSKAVSSVANIATIFSESEDFDFAISKYKECVEILRKTDDTKALAMTLFNLGEIYLYIKELDTAEIYLKEAVAISHTNNHTNIQARALDCLAGICFFKSDLNGALKWELEASEVMKDDNDIALKSNIQVNISSILLKQGEHKKALTSLNSVLPSLEKMKNDKYWMKYYKQKSIIEEKLNDFESAYYSRLEFEKLTIELYNTEKLKIIEEGRKKTDELMTKLINLEREKELADLKNKKELQDKELTYKALQIVQKNELISSIMSSLETLQSRNPQNVKIINEMLELISVDSASQSVWEEFEKWFTEVNTNFFENLLLKVPDITNRFRQLAAFIKLGLRSKEIALLMGISTESVEKYRLRFRKKLNLTRGETLSSFIENL